MNLILGTLIDLKTHLLNESLRAQTTYDASLAALGMGVATAFQEICNRSFARTLGDVYETNADRTKLVVLRYPIEQVTKIEIRDSLSQGYVDQGAVANVLFNLRERAGLLEFAGYLGGSFSRMRVTYDGGWWVDYSDDGSGVLPVGATALPPDLHLAWLLQCEAVWALRDKLGVNLMAGTEHARVNPALTIQGVQILPGVLSVLNQHIRYAID